MNKDMVYIGLTIILLVFGAFLVTERFGKKDMNEQNKILNNGNTVLSDGTWSLDVSKSSLDWRGERTILTTHIDKGTLSFSSGDLKIENGVIVSGSMKADMNTLALSSVHGKTPEEGGGEMLRNHLMSDDFFSVEQYPEASFVVKSVAVGTTSADVIVTGDMIIKGITNSITFPAVLTNDGEDLVLSASLELDRTLWNIRFGSANFFNDLGDKVISNSIWFDVSARFVKDPEAGVN